MKLTQVREQQVKKLQLQLAERLQKQQWFLQREQSIEMEVVKLEEESRQVRLRGELLREREIEGFLEGLEQALQGIIAKQKELALEVLELRGKLEEALKARKVVDKLEELHYNQRLQKRRKRGED